MHYINNHKEAINLYGTLDPEIVGMIIHDIAILTHTYGIESLNKNDLSKPGSVVVLEANESLELLEKEFPHVLSTEPEFDDDITCHVTHEVWKHYLFIYASEYSISVFQKKN